MDGHGPGDGEFLKIDEVRGGPGKDKRHFHPTDFFFGGKKPRIIHIPDPIPRLVGGRQHHVHPSDVHTGRKRFKTNQTNRRILRRYDAHSFLFIFKIFLPIILKTDALRLFSRQKDKGLSFLFMKHNVCLFCLHSHEIHQRLAPPRDDEWW